jgi:two-component system OmpR family sensor kinase
MSPPNAPEPQARAWPVRARILASILVVASAGLAIAGAVAYFTQREGILAAIDDRLRGQVESARLVVGAAPLTQAQAEAVPAVPSAAPDSTRAALQAVLTSVVPGPHEGAIGLVEGTAAYIPGIAMDLHLEDAPEFIARVALESADGQVRLGTSVSRLGHVRYIAVPITVAGDPETGVFVGAVDISAALADLDAAFRTYALVAVITLGAITLVGWFVAGRLLRPLRQVREAASRITATDISERIPVTGRDDLSDLTRTLNDMLERIDGSARAQQRLLDDVRHELQTPLTIVRGHLELLDPADAGEVSATRDLALDELDRMSQLVVAIGSLADTGQAAVHAEPVDVEDLTADVFAKAAVIAGHEWELAERARVIATLDAPRITQAWLQLVDNAAKYSPPGSLVRLGSTRRDGTVELWVEDRGDGIPPDMEERIFERFGRVETGRGVSGSGLGLSIVKTIAEAHGGRVSLGSSTAGSRFAIVIPLEPVAGGVGS